LSRQLKKEGFMTALQLNAELYKNLGIIAEDETMMQKVVKYVRKLAKQMTDDSTCMTKEEFFARVDEAEKGPSRSFASVEELDQYLRSL